MIELEFKEDCRRAGLTDAETRLLSTPFKHLGMDDRGRVFAASDKLARYRQRQPHLRTCSMLIQDKDVLLKDGVISPIEGKAYHNRREWNDHLKRHGVREIGNDFNNAHEKPRELKGDYNVRPALAEAIKEVLTKRKYR